MFDIPDKDKRKYQCFVCGVQFENFKEYCNHIKEKHEEGRDYVICPVSHCQAPIRDLRSHFKHKHPSLKMPNKDGMNKAIIWRDFNPKKNKMQVRKPKFREGYYHSTKMQVSFHYRSGYEVSVYECLDADVDVSSFEAEPFEIEYIHKGKLHNYTPDIVVRFIDGHVEVWEIKPSKQTLLPKNQDKWAAANEACKTRGWEFVVITETGIDRLKNKIKKQKLLNE
jgi:RNase P protein component